MCTQLAVHFDHLWQWSQLNSSDEQLENGAHYVVHYYTGAQMFYHKLGPVHFLLFAMNRPFPVPTSERF